MLWDCQDGRGTFKAGYHVFDPVKVLLVRSVAVTDGTNDQTPEFGTCANGFPNWDKLSVNYAPI